jgi:uncharacterized protein YndB with AHSA1/START domain
VVTRRSRAVRAEIGTVWRLATDPDHLPRWWPATQRVEGVSGEGWTSVFATPRGRPVRADYAVAALEPPELARWRQEIAGTPFERFFSSIEYELRLSPSPTGTDVSLQIDQAPRGWARLGRIQLRRAARARLDDALAGLAGLLEDPGR